MKKLSAINWGSLEGEAVPKLKGADLGDVVAAVIPYIYTAAGIFLLLYLIASGFSYITSLGDPKKVQAAKGKLTNALLGFFLVLFSYLIIQLIANVFNIEHFKTIFGGYKIGGPW